MMTKEEYQKEANKLIQSYWETYLKSDDKVAHLNSLIGVKNDLVKRIDFNVEQAELNLKKLKDNIDIYSKINFKIQLAKAQKNSDPNNIKKLAFKVSSNLDSYYRFSVYFGLRQKEISKKEMIENARTILSKNDIKTLKKTLYRLDAIASATLRKHMLQEFISQIEQAGFPDQSTLSRLTFLQNNTNEIQPIHWLNGEESLRQFIDSLKSAGLIENRDTDDLIQEHFYVDGQAPTKKPQPMNWLKSKVLLAYLIKELSTKPEMHEPFIKPKNKWQLTNLHFTVKGEEIVRSLVNDIKQSRYPNGSEKIDSILNRLTKH